ncbi:hypothetical protein MMC09_003783 [Bachmanniomyces sp. S44760]|nr:hypothetical protein [Bachmanniomyces sp. S44760]
MTASLPTQPGPKERFFRYFQHEATALQEQMERLENLSPIGGERSDAIDHCLAGIARLSHEVHDASVYIPAYDQRTYGEAIKALGEKLDETRLAFAPRSKFTFSTGRKNNSAISLNDAAEIASERRRHVPGYRSDPSSTESSMATTPANLATPPNGPSNSSNVPEASQSNLGTIPESPGTTRNPADPNSPAPQNTHSAAIRKPSFTSSSAVSLSSLSGVHVVLPSSASHATSSGTLTSIKHSIVDMSIPTNTGQPFAGLILKNIRESLILCGTVHGAAHITKMEQSVLVLTTRQFRMHECKNCVVYLHSSSRPIIEDCTGIRFAPLPRLYSQTSTNETPETPSPPSSTKNQYDQVDDFKWLKAEHSPNWSLLAPEDVVPDHIWRDIVPGGPGHSLDDILRATGVVR